MIPWLLTFPDVLCSFVKTYSPWHDSRSREDAPSSVPTGEAADEKEAREGGGGGGVGGTPTVKLWGSAAIDCNLNPRLMIAHTVLRHCPWLLSKLSDFWERWRFAEQETAVNNVHTSAQSSCTSVLRCARGVGFTCRL